jgi:excinuclease ABC subunit B
MKEAAANLEFEEAARLRDEIRRLETSELGVRAEPGTPPAARAEHERAKGQNPRGRARRMAGARRQRSAGGRR